MRRRRDCVIHLKWWSRINRPRPFIRAIGTSERIDVLFEAITRKRKMVPKDIDCFDQKSVVS